MKIDLDLYSSATPLVGSFSLQRRLAVISRSKKRTRCLLYDEKCQRIFEKNEMRHERHHGRSLMAVTIAAYRELGRGDLL